MRGVRGVTQTSGDYTETLTRCTGMCSFTISDMSAYLYLSMRRQSRMCSHICSLQKPNWNQSQPPQAVDKRQIIHVLFPVFFYVLQIQKYF